MTKISNQYSLTNILTADLANSRLGINNVSPTVALDVTGAGKFSGALTGTSATFSGSVGVGGSVDTYQQMTITASTAYTVLGLYNTAAGSTQRNWSLATNDIAAGDFTIRQSGAAGGNPFAGGGVVRLMVNAAGNVGIGTSSPSSLLQVNGQFRQVYSKAFSSNPLDSDAFSGHIIVNSNNTNGNLSGIAMYTNSSYTAATGLFAIQESSTAAGMVFYTGSNTASERMRITSAGKVGIGFTAPGGKLDVQDTGLAAPVDGQPGTGLNIRRTDGVLGLAIGYDDNGSSYLQVNRMDGNLTSVYHLMLQPVRGNVFIGTTTGAYKLTLNGQPGANGYTAWTNYSDRRLKENIEPFVSTNILDKINLLNPVTFNYNEVSGYDEETRARRISGFIAQELQEIFPEMVGTLKLNNEEYLDTNLSNLSLYLVKAVQELSAKVSLLENK